MYIFNKEDIKKKLHFIKGKKVGLTYKWLLQKVIKSLWKVDTEKSFVLG